MSAIPIVGKCFATTAEFLAYLEGLKFGAWRPRFVTMRHTGAPGLKAWRDWQTRAEPVSDEQWLKNLADWYPNLPDAGVIFGASILKGPDAVERRAEPPLEVIPSRKVGADQTGHLPQHQARQDPPGPPKSRLPRHPGTRGQQPEG